MRILLISLFLPHSEAPHAGFRYVSVWRFGTVRPTGPTPVVRSDNALIFQSRRFRRAYHDCRLSQEFVTPYTPEQNGLIERFFRSLKEECAWLDNFATFADAKTAIRRWIDWYNDGRPHQALGYQSPRENRAQLASMRQNADELRSGRPRNTGRYPRFVDSPSGHCQ